jgi:hypothetical protein
MPVSSTHERDLPSLEELITITQQAIVKKFNNLIPQTNGQLLSLFIASVGFALWVLGWIYFWREYHFYRRAHAKTH